MTTDPMAGGYDVLTTFALVYLGGWAATTGLTYVASRRLADGADHPPQLLRVSACSPGWCGR